MSADPAGIGLADRDARDGLLPEPQVSLHILDDSGVLFDAASGRTYALNTTATFIWCCVEEGQASAEISQRLRKTFNLSGAEAGRYVTSALRAWREAGLLGNRRIRVTGEARPAAVIPFDVQAEPASEAARGPVREHRLYRLLDMGFHILTGEEGLRDEVDALLAPLAVSAAPRTSARLELIGDPAGFVLRKDGARFARCEQRDQVIPLVKASLIRIALERSDDFGAVHSAAVAYGGRCLLIVGKSGSGKSTLSAALAGSGFCLLGDDTTVLARDTLHARPVPFAICLKGGAWPLLADRFPEIWRQPRHHRLDGKYVRYLPPDKAARIDPTVALPISAVIFLRREDGVRPRLPPLGRAEALSRLAAEFSPLGTGLDRVKIGQLVAWIGKIDCRDLHFSSLDDGVGMLRDFCA